MFEELGKMMVSWKKYRGHLIVYTYGYVNNETIKIDDMLKNYGMVPIKRDFNAKLQRTQTTYREVKK